MVGGKTLTPEQYLRHQFLEMYKNNTGYFLNDNTLEYWRSITGYTDLKSVESIRLGTFLNTESYNSDFLNFIIAK